jgi:hypothetical protein
MIDILMIESVLILICAILALFRLKNWLYKKQNLEIKKWEEYVFQLGGFIILLIIGLKTNCLYLLMMSLAFIFWILYDAINFDIKLWREFLKIIRR